MLNLGQFQILNKHFPDKKSFLTICLGYRLNLQNKNEGMSFTFTFVHATTFVQVTNQNKLNLSFYLTNNFSGNEVWLWFSSFMCWPLVLDKMLGLDLLGNSNLINFDRIRSIRSPHFDYISIRSIRLIRSIRSIRFL